MYMYNSMQQAQGSIRYYEISWYVEANFGNLGRYVKGSEEQINILAESLKDDPAIKDLKVQLAHDQTAPLCGHFHTMDEVVQSHDWKQCPDNPDNIF